MLFSRTTIALRALLLAASLAAAGCGPSISGICDDLCDCVGCSDREYDDCVDELEDAEEQAIDEGCDAEFDDYLDCVDSESECRGDDFETDESCNGEFVDLVSCVN